jgi:hypothetical protein
MTDSERDALLIRLDERTDSLHHEVCGNGQPGLRQRVQGLELWRSMLIGGWLLLVAAITAWAALKQ